MAASRLSATVSTSGRKSRNKSARKSARKTPEPSVVESEKTDDTLEHDTGESMCI